MNNGADRFRQVHVAALALVAIMLPWSEFLLSNAQFLLIGNWLVEGVVRKDLGGRFTRAFSSAPAFLFLSFLGLHALGLLWTEDLTWGLDLCRILLPVLAFTPVLASSPRLSAAELRIVLLLGAWSTVASTVVCLIARYDLLGQGAYRELSIFISHIRLALMICLSIAVFVHCRSKRWWLRIGQFAAAAWCVFFLDRLSSLLGFVVLGALLVLSIWRWSSARPAGVRWAARSALLALPAAAAVYGYTCVRAYHSDGPEVLRDLSQRSAGGEYYWHDLERPQRENGHYVWINVADRELERAWQLRSRIPYRHMDQLGQPLRWTLVRYMASKGLTKDSVGALALTDEDVRRVEMGINNALQGRRDPLRTRIDQVLFELESYRLTGNASGYSVVMRYEFLRAGLAIAGRNAVFGTGTGDTRPTFAEEYERRGSKLQPRWRLRAHNQYLTLFISFGAMGLLWSLFSWVWPAWRTQAYRAPLFLAWAIIFGISCLSEDTLETQMGATFFAYYYALFVFAAPTVTSTRPTDPPRAAG